MSGSQSHTQTGAGTGRWVGLGVTLMLLAGIAAPPAADATPAYGRRYGVSCTTCHAPLPPRLNNLGILFRKSGFRMPDTDDKDQFILKTVPAHDIGDATALAANVAARRDDEAEEGNRATLELGEVEATAGTAIGKHVSAQAMFVPFDDGEVELENAEIQYNIGGARSQFVGRAGLIQTYLWQKANHGSLTLSTPLIFSGGHGAAEAAGPISLGLGANQVAAEAGYVRSRLTEGKLTSTMFTAAVLNGVNAEGETAFRNPTGGADVYLQAMHLFGSRNTVSLFFYRGRTIPEAEHDEEGEEGEEAEMEEGPGEVEEEGLDTRQNFTRYGVRANYLLFGRLDLVAGGTLGRDRLEPSDRETQTRGLFAEAVVTLSKRWLGAYRFDLADPNRDEDDDAVRAHTVSTTFQADDHLYLTAEYRSLRRPGDTSGTFVANARLVY